MTSSNRTTLRYSLSFKQQVVRELETEGATVGFLAIKYGIKGGATIQGWLRKFGKGHLLNQVVRIETMDEKARLKTLEQEVKKLKMALADSVLAQRVLEVVIKHADKEYQTDLKKNFGETASTS